jgi:cytochrome c peroxidase
MSRVNRFNYLRFVLVIFNILIVLIIGNQIAIAQEVLPFKADIPTDNPQLTEKILLGKTLFFDPRLSLDGTVSCNSCHNVMGGGEDGRSFSVGVGAQLGGRNAPTVWNSAFHSVQFWDGRAATLEDQAKGPLVNPLEMAMKNLDAVVSRINQIPGYREMFEKVFKSKEAVNIDNVAKAIASFERTLITPNARFDKYIRGNKRILSSVEIKGYEVMKTTGCFSCHSGINFSGPKLPVGTGFYMKFPTFLGSEFDAKYNLLKDEGRFAVTKKVEDLHFYKVPTLRNIAITAPYFHNGSVATLDEAVRVMAKTQLNKQLKDDEVKAVVSFLNTLSGEKPKIIAPELPSIANRTLIQ